MDKYSIYRYIELIIFSSYLIFIFLSIQIWLLWKEIDKRELKLKIFVSESFFKKIFGYVLFSIIFSMMHEFFEGRNLPDATIYIEFFEMLALISLVLFTYEWYYLLKKYVPKKPLPLELTNFNNGKV